MAMTYTGMARELSALVRLDIDAAHACSLALQVIESQYVKDQVIRFQKDHERHIEQLSAVIRALDAEPPSYTSDFQGFLTDSFVSPLGCPGAGSPMQTMKANEELTTGTYRRSSEMDFTPNIKELVTRNYHDEKTHLKFIEEALAGRRWEKDSGGVHAPSKPKADQG